MPRTATDTTTRRRILIVTRNFPPLMGGMERLNWHMAQELARDYKVRVIAPKGASQAAPAGVEVHETPLRPLWLFLLAAGVQALIQAITFRPDTVLAGSGLTAPLALISARLCRAKAAAYVHGLDLAVAHAIYRRLWLPAIRRLDCVIANSRTTAALAEHVGVPPQRIAIVHPGVELPNLNADERIRMRQAFRAQYDLGERPLLLSVGRLTARKGLVEFICHCMPAIVAARPDARLVIIGEPAKDALNKPTSDIAGAIRTATQELGLEKYVLLLSGVDDRTLSNAYLAADVHIFPVREIPNDPEGFGMVAVEAAAHGLPTAGFAVGGIPDAVAEGVSGRLAPPGNYTALTHIVLELLEAPATTSPDACRRHAANFTWDRFGQKIRSVYPLTMKQ